MLVKLLIVNDDVVLKISITPEVNAELPEDCHFKILPVVPVKVSIELFVPEQTEADPTIEPATEGAVPIMITPFEYAGAEGALVTFAR